MIDASNFYLVHWITPNDDATNFTRKLMGKFVIDGDRVEILSDYHDFLHRILPENGVIDQHVDRRIESLFHSSYLQVTRKSDGDTDPVQAAKDLGIHDPNGGSPLPDAAAIVDSRAISKPQPVFDYQRVGMDQPHTVEIRAGKVTLDGNLLSDEEAAFILKNVQTGVATLRYKKPLVPFAKAERLFKAATLGMSMEGIKALVAAHGGPDSAEHFDMIRRELYHDEMTPLGNKRAFREHEAGGSRPGVYMSIDGNSIKAINDTHGHEAGDEAIVGMGHAMRRAIDNSVGSEHVKAFRTGGDEFVLHAPSHEHAAQVLRQLHTELEAHPPIRGTHKLSVSAGLGADFKTADKALYGAKDQKLAAIKATGGDPSDRMASVPHAMYAHSLVPGHEGPVPSSNPSPLSHVNPPVVPEKTPLRAAPPTAPHAPTGPLAGAASARTET